MRIGYIKLTNYVGIYNGMNLNEFYIDFSKCKYKKIIIKGDNGSGKSTLMKAMHILPDDNSAIIPGLEGRKELVIINYDISYEIQIIHPINTKGNRATIKAYVTKSTPEGSIQLNPNGNVTSYKDIMIEELSLDSNFLSLTKLSGEFRGLSSLKPSERKKFVSALVSSTVRYDEMYKAFSKKSSLYKSMRNSIISKINNIGNMEQNISRLKSMDRRYDELNGNMNECKETIAIQRAKISSLDKDNTIQDKFKQISQEIKEINPQIRDNENKINISTNKIGNNITKDNINLFYQSLLTKQTELETIIKLNQSKIDSILQDREREGQQLQELNGKLVSLDSDSMSRDSLNKAIVECNKNIDYYSKTIRDMKIRNINDISKEEYILALETLQDIKKTIFNINDEYDYHIVEKSIMYINNQLQLNDNHDRLIEIRNTIDNDKDLLLEYRELKGKLSVLNDRPKECNINTCPLIIEALEAQKLNPIEEYNKLEEEIYNLQILYDNLQRESEDNDKIIICSKTINTLIHNIDRNTSIMRKLLLDDTFMNSSRVLELIMNDNIFDEVNKIYKFIDVANIIDLYKQEINKLNEYNSRIKIYEEKEAIIDSITTQIKYLQDKLNSISLEMDNCNNEIINAKNQLSNIKSAILEVQYIIELFNNQESLINRKQELLDEFETIKQSMKTIKECVDNINILTNEYNNIIKELNPLSQERDNLKHSIKLFDEYQKELEEYNKKFELIETLKKYSSPTTGIQTIFINLYMNKTLSLANEMLSMMFNGKYVLSQFIVNENEFRIPCMGSGLMNDDISSMSSAETCMIGMIISFAMLRQANTQYNILSLDEVDGVLDQSNRFMFLTVLDRLIDLLNVEQCFIISHNSEINMRDCDVIVLKTSDQYTNFDGNIIYNYNI